MAVSRPLPLEGQVAIVTGGKRGIGKAIALALAEAGADVAICSRDIEDGSLEAAAQEIRALGRRSLAVRADTSKKSDVDEMVRVVTAELGEIDVLVNNAGVILWATPALDLAQDDWDRLLGVNLTGYFLCCQAVAKRMVARNKGAIVNVTSVAGIAAKGEIAAYCVAKAGATMLTEVLAVELAKHQIRVNAVAPAFTKTEMNASLRSGPDDEKKLGAQLPLGRLGEPQDIAKAVVFLATEQSAYITGQTLIVDGGMTVSAIDKVAPRIRQEQ